MWNFLLQNFIFFLDINECRLPKPPCPKYLCENTIGGFTCAGKPGKPFTEDATNPTPELGVTPTPPAKVDICPIGFRAGPDDECLGKNAVLILF